MVQPPSRTAACLSLPSAHHFDARRFANRRTNSVGQHWSSIARLRLAGAWSPLAQNRTLSITNTRSISPSQTLQLRHRNHSQTFVVACNFAKRPATLRSAHITNTLPHLNLQQTQSNTSRMVGQRHQQLPRLPMTIPTVRSNIVRSIRKRQSRT